MPKTDKISCVVWGRKGYGKTTLRENLAKEFGEIEDVTTISKDGKPSKNRNTVTVTSRAWFGITADTISSLANSYPIRIDMKEIRNSFYSLESDYYVRHLINATVILYVIDATARWELHEERPLFEKFLQLLYSKQRGPPLAVVFTKCDHVAAEADFIEEAMGLTARSWKCWPNIPDYRVLKVQSLDKISEDIHVKTSKTCKMAYDLRNLLATVLVISQNNAPFDENEQHNEPEQWGTSNELSEQTTGGVLHAY